MLTSHKTVVKKVNKQHYIIDSFTDLLKFPQMLLSELGSKPGSHMAFSFQCFYFCQILNPMLQSLFVICILDTLEEYRQGDL